MTGTTRPVNTSVPPLHVWALVRLDHFLGTLTQSAVTVKAIFTHRQAAEGEAARLNSLNTEKGVEYFVQVTRFATPHGDAVP